MGSKAKALAAWLMICCLALSSCSGSIPLNPEPVAVTLPPAQSSYVAPIGDAALEYTGEATLFLPRADNARLSAITQAVAYSAARPQAESVARALLAHEGNSVLSSLGGSVKLSLYGANPVELSRDVATVNLSASALQLDRKAFFLACQAITNTLTSLPGIHYVNVLVMDRSLGLDIAGALPMGSLSRSVGEDAGALYEQLLTQRVKTAEDPASKGLTAPVTLYFPLSHLDGILPEVRSCSFESQAPSDMVARLLEELAAGPQQVNRSPALPQLASLLATPPEVTEAPEGGGRLITLRYGAGFDDMLTGLDLNRATVMASICHTLATFLPGIGGVRFYIGQDRVQNVLVRDSANQVAILFNEAVQYRADYSAFLMDISTLYFASQDGQKLLEVERPMPYYLTKNPRALVLELAKGPQSFDSQPAFPLLSAGALRDSDLVGFSLNDTTLLVNFAPTFSLVGQGFSPQQDRLLAYGLVNTLSSISRIRRVCFFVAGEWPKDFSGTIQWSGAFYKNTGLVRSPGR
ncbi:MAG: GerMN domain-containing protein [Candidatus Limiplasma sp.]|nr:GerMN domain-containing protein [Candidatus Limiplasma sp.]